jgi:hypothetical protein
MFAGEAGAYRSEALFRYSTLGMLLALPANKTRPERLARDKHSSLLQAQKVL